MIQNIGTTLATYQNERHLSDILSLQTLTKRSKRFQKAHDLTILSNLFDELLWKVSASVERMSTDESYRLLTHLNDVNSVIG